ncbi:Cation/H(+) antiporter 20 [Ancistrocladus abbreviatus]
MPLNISSIKTSSDGAWEGDNPLNYAFPLLIVQTTLVLGVSRLVAFLLKPLRQPKVVAEIVGGILLGPSALGQNKNFLHWVFPPWSTPILESVASIGLLFFLFLVGLELDLSTIRRSGKRAFGIAFVGISLPFAFGAGVTLILRRAIHEANWVSYGQSLVFMGVALSITAFPVLARILAELKLLTTDVGEMAMAAAAFNDVAAWVMLALAIALTGNTGNGHGLDHKSSLTSIWVLFSGIAFTSFMLIIVRPAMTWVARKCLPEDDILDQAYVCITLIGVMLSGFITDLIGIHAIFGAFVFGLTIPKGSDFANRLIKRIEDFVSTLLLPLYFASSGLKTDVAKINGAEAWGLLVLVISTACAGKILGTFLVAMLCTIPVRESLALGVLMNTKGMVELIVLNIGKEKKVLNDEMFTILVLMALFTTFITTPAVMAIYKSNHSSSINTQRNHLNHSKSWSISSDNSTTSKFHILACVHGPGNVPSMVTLIELARSTIKRSILKLYTMHLVELTDRTSSIMMVQRARKNGQPLVNCFGKGKKARINDQVAIAFEAYAEASKVVVRPMTAISTLHTMHEDICHVVK